MSTKRTVISVFAAVLLTAGCLGAAAPLGGADSPAPNSTAPPTNQTGADATVRVGASGEATADPDRAVAAVGVEATAADAETARQRVAENVSTLRDALAAAGIEDDQVTTRHYAIRQVHESKRSESTPTRYEAVHSFEVRISDVDAVGSVIETAVDNGATNVGRVEFTLSEETRTELREEALAAAMDSARGDAETLASNANLSLAGVTSVSTSDVRVQPYRAEAEMAADGAATSIESGPVSVHAQVQVAYAATEASE
ncbi:SIMPL domain-containing protein [Halorussus marinus]|uniref:SIMPL domain-containing protein n=1 Tax=Halorussus marinus TaxID=2505976 RepID=UPI00106EA8C0|nr:SIMPL domain-containing protein [Halorussus marinus]